MPGPGWLLAIVVWALAAIATQAAAEDVAGPSGLTGDWGGRRERLADRGVRPYAVYTAGFWANVHGGFETGIRYEGFAQWGLDLDLDPLLGWPGARFHLGWNSYHGGQPSTELVGLYSTTFLSGWEGETSARFYEIYLEQRLFSDWLAFRVGQLAVDEVFGLSQYSDALLNAGLGFLNLGREEQLAPFYPVAAPGLDLRVGRPDGRFLARFGVYTADPGPDELSNFGFDWSLDEGASILAEVGVRASPLGRPGRYVFGVSGTTATVLEVQRGREIDGGWGLFGTFDQLLVARPALGLFFRFEVTPGQPYFPLRVSLDGGLELTGPLPCRPHDVVSAGVVYLELDPSAVLASFASGTPVSDRQTVLELTYRARVTRWLTLQPDLQVAFDPTFSGRDAVVLGLRAVITL